MRPRTTRGSIVRRPRKLDRRVVAGGERVDWQRIPVRSPVCRDREQCAQPVSIGERGLHAMTRVLLRQIARIDVLEAPVPFACATWACDQRMTQLVEDQPRGESSASKCSRVESVSVCPRRMRSSLGVRVFATLEPHVVGCA